METYSIDGTEASIGPVEVRWRRFQVGTDHNAAPIYSGKEQIECRFPPCSVTMARQWTSIEDGGSHTIDMILPSTTQFRTLSPVYVTVTEPPAMADINATAFTIVITNAERETLT